MPQEDGLREILTLLKESQSPDNATQRAVQQVSFLNENVRTAAVFRNTFSFHMSLQLLLKFW